MPKLKVYRTPAGFHDAYVAASSQKAALAAWGSTANLFARGLAEIVTDPALTKAPLEQPGTIVKVARTAADAPPERVRPSKTKRAEKAKPVPKPSRAALDAAEAALDEAEARFAAETSALRREEEALARRRRALEKQQAEERAALDRTRIRARDDHDAALAAWKA